MKRLLKLPRLEKPTSRHPSGHRPIRGEEMLRTFQAGAGAELMGRQAEDGLE
jgi:hypothetical protein